MYHTGLDLLYTEEDERTESIENVRMDIERTEPSAPDTEPSADTTDEIKYILLYRQCVRMMKRNSERIISELYQQRVINHRLIDTIVNHTALADQAKHTVDIMFQKPDYKYNKFLKILYREIPPDYDDPPASYAESV